MPPVGSPLPFEPLRQEPLAAASLVSEGSPSHFHLFIRRSSVQLHEKLRAKNGRRRMRRLR